MGHSDFTITESGVTSPDAPDDEWTLESISCVNGAGEDVAATVDDRHEERDSRASGR